MIDQMGGRKVTVICIATILAVALVLAKGDIPTNFLDWLKYGVGFFIAGNGVEHVAAAMAGRGAPEAPTLDMGPVQAGIEELRASTLTTQQGIAQLQQILMEILKRFGGVK